MSNFITFLTSTAVAVTSLWKPPLDIDLWWHLKTGEVMWREKTILKTDIFSYTGYGHEWINHEWGTEVIYYLLNHHFGTPGILGFRWLIASLTLFFVARTAYFLSQSLSVSLLVSSLLFQFGISRYLDHPSMVSTMMIAATFWLLTGVQTGRWREKTILALLPLFTLWANLHGGVVIGLAVVGLFWTPEILKGQKILKKLILLTFLILVSLLNPFGFRVLTFPFENLTLTAPMANTLEWLNPFNPMVSQMKEVRWIPFLFVGLGLTFLLFRQTIGASYLLVLGLVSVMVARAVRFLPEFVCVTTPLIAASLPLRLRVSRLTWIPAILLMGTLLTWNGRIIRLAPLNLQLFIFLTQTDLPYFAPDIMLFLKQNNIHGKVFNDINLGSSFIYFLGPEEKVFIDGRHNIYGNDFYIEARWAMVEPKTFEALSQRYGGFNYVLLTSHAIGPDLKLFRYLWESRDWELVYVSIKGVVFVKKLPQFKKVIQQYAVKTLPFEFEQSMPFLKRKDGNKK